MRRFVLACALASALPACSSPPPDPAAAPLVDVERGTRALSRAMAISTAFLVPGSLSGTATPDSAAIAISNRLKDETGGCATITRSGPSVNLDLGATGCTLATAGIVVAGNTTASITPGGSGGLLVSLALENTVEAGADALGGSFAIETPDGNAFTFGADLTLTGTEAKVPYLRGATSGGESNYATARGTLLGSGVGAAGVMLDAEALEQRFDACYPKAGMVTAGGLVVTFADDTPQTGTVTVTDATSTRTVQMPVRSGCPRTK